MAALIGGAIGGIGSLLGGIFGSGASKKAGQVLNQAGQTVAGNINQAVGTAGAGEASATAGGQQAVAAGTTAAQGQVAGGIQAGNNTLQNVFTGQTNNLNPYLQAGNTGVSQLTNMGQFTAPTAAQAAATPGEQFIMQQGTAALNRSAAASGLSQSGGQLKALTQYGQNLASTYYQQAYNNAQSTYQANQAHAGALTNLGQFGTQQYNQAAQNYGAGTNQNLMQGNEYWAGIGMQGSQSVANLGMQGQQEIGNWGVQGSEAAGQALMQGAQGQAAGIMGQANAWSSALGGATNSVGQGLTNYGMMNGQNSFGGFGGGMGMEQPNSSIYTPTAPPSFAVPGGQVDPGDFANLP